MRNRNKLLIFVILLAMGFAPRIFAQNNLEIDRVFEKYGRQKGAVMVEMSKEMLDGYDFTYYKSIVVNDSKEAGDLARLCLKSDQKNAKKVKQVVSNGEVSSIYLQLPRKGKYHRLILFNESVKPNRKMTLIYIESEKDSEEILKLILKKK
ncbi:MAG: DUF6108 family protein [Paludibacteraceae bacterium]